MYAKASDSETFGRDTVDRSSLHFDRSRRARGSTTTTTTHNFKGIAGFLSLIHPRRNCRKDISLPNVPSPLPHSSFIGQHTLEILSCYLYPPVLLTLILEGHRFRYPLNPRSVLRSNIRDSYRLSLKSETLQRT